MRYFDRQTMRRPDVLDSARFQNAREKLNQYLAESDERLQRQQRAPVEPGLTNHPEIKEALSIGFGGLCAYCEADMRAFKFFDVEHHRPKFSAEDQKGRSDHRYYVWLAYEWDNLLPVCRDCNNAKRNKYYVTGDRGPVGAPVGALRELEGSLLLDPCYDDIAEHLSFEAPGIAIPKDEKGRITIELLMLNRVELVMARRRQLLQILAMLTGGLELAAIRTGLPGGWGSSVIAGMGGEPLPHAGAITLAILGRAAGLMPGVSDIIDFLERWRLWSARDQQRFAAGFEGESFGAGTDEKPGDADEGAPRRRDRQFRVAGTASAEELVREVHIRNFKAIAAIDLELPPVAPRSELAPCVMLLGENATGKSSILEAIALALIGTREAKALDKLVAADEIGPAQYRHRPDPANWDVVASAPLAVEIRFLGLEDGAVISGGEEGDFSGTARPSKIVLAYGPRRYFPPRSARRFSAPAYRVRSLFDPMVTIANPIAWLADLRRRDLAKFDAAVRALRIILMLKDTALIDAKDARVMVETPHGPTPLDKMSVGYKSVIAMAIDIIRELFVHYDNLEYASAVVLVDEIETHLHPRWKMQIVGLLREALPRVQFIMTTHDPLCLRGMYQGEVFVLRRDEDNRIDMLKELPDVQGMRAEQILTSEFFGLGSTDPATDAKVERYQYLTLQPVLTLDQQDERLRLAGEIEEQMTVGVTIGQQTDAEAVRLANLEEGLRPVKVEDDTRKRMIEEALAKLTGA